MPRTRTTRAARQVPVRSGSTETAAWFLGDSAHGPSSETGVTGSSRPAPLAVTGRAAVRTRAGRLPRRRVAAAGAIRWSRWRPDDGAVDAQRLEPGASEAQRTFWAAIQASTRRSSTSSGSEPWSSTASWKARTSKRGAERLLRPGPELADLQLAHLVGQRLPGMDDVPVHLVGDVQLLPGRVLQEVLDGPRAAPALHVHPGVDHQADRAPHLVGQLPGLVRRVVHQPQLVGQPLGVEAPALAEGHVVAVAAEGGQVLLLGGERHLEVVARDRLVQGERHHLPRGPRLGLVGVDPVGPGARAVVGGRVVEAGGRVGSHRRRGRLHAVRAPAAASPNSRVSRGSMRLARSREWRSSSSPVL